MTIKFLQLWTQFARNVYVLIVFYVVQKNEENFSVPTSHGAPRIDSTHRV
jgi:hypothetical protein